MEPTLQQAGTNESALLEEYRAALDAQDAAASVLADRRRETEEVESRIVRTLQASGRWAPGCKAGIKGLSVTVQQKWRAIYDPALWPKIVEWAAQTGNQHIIQRRLSDRPVLELHDAGTALPDGLNLESHNELAFRRS